MFRCLFVLLLVGCSTQDPAATVDPNDVDYNDPHADAQNVHLADELIEIEALPAGTEQTIEVPLQNTGPFELVVESVRMASWSDTQWTLVEETVPAVVAANSEVILQVRYVAPLGRDAFAALEVRSDDPDEARVATGLIGRAAVGAPEPRLDPPVLDFGFVFRDEEVRSTITLRNDGDQPVSVLSLALQQSASQAAFGLSCPGQPLILEDDEPPACASWQADVLDPLLASPLESGDSVSFEVAYVPTTPVTHSAQLVLTTSDPQRPTITATVRGNGDRPAGCTPPTITLLSPTEPVFFQSGVGAHLEVEVQVEDAEQPAGTMFVELYSGDLLIEDEFTDPQGFATFDIDIDLQEEPDMPQGLLTLTLRAVDGCPLTAETSFVAFIGGIFTGTDTDGDGWSIDDGDCNDSDDTVYPGAHEARDAKDNDCDVDIDEGTAIWDNDCDGYCADAEVCLGQGPAPDDGECTGLAAEPYNDCDDDVRDDDGDGLADGRDANPGADEQANHRDDDCDGSIDEGTALRDDDGDGMTENAGDCDDSEPTVFSGAVEWCDDLDNDCEGGVDDDCLETSHEPRLAGPVRVDRFEISLGTRVEARVVVLAEEGADVSFEWVADKGSFSGETDADTVVWQSPADTSDNLGLVPSFANLQATVRDAEDRAHSEFGEVHIASSIGGDVAVEGTGCSAAGGGGGLLAGLMFLLGRRRRVGVLVAALMLAMVVPASAAELGGVTMADSVMVGGTKVPLQGMGLRKMLMIKIYVAGLYTDAGSTSAAVIASKNPKAVVMTMKIGLSGEKVADSIEKGFERNSGASMGTLRTRLDKLKGLFPSFEKGDTVTLSFDPARGTVLTGKSGEIGVIEGKDFSDALFKVWLGSDPVDDSLMDGMLGK